jgi:hypothetical protein
LQAKDSLFELLNTLLLGVLNDALAGCSVGKNI